MFILAFTRYEVNDGFSTHKVNRIVTLKMFQLSNKIITSTLNSTTSNDAPVALKTLTVLYNLQLANKLTFDFYV